MPDLGEELHRWRFEGVLVRNFDGDGIGAAGVGRVGRPGNRASQVLEADAILGCGKDARVVAVGLNVLEFFGDAAVAAAGHGGRARRRGEPAGWVKLGRS